MMDRSADRADKAPVRRIIGTEQESTIVVSPVAARPSDDILGDDAVDALVKVAEQPRTMRRGLAALRVHIDAELSGSSSEASQIYAEELGKAFGRDSKTKSDGPGFNYVYDSGDPVADGVANTVLSNDFGVRLEVTLEKLRAQRGSAPAHSHTDGYSLELATPESLSLAEVIAREVAGERLMAAAAALPALRPRAGQRESFSGWAQDTPLQVPHSKAPAATPEPKPASPVVRALQAQQAQSTNTEGR